MAVSFFTEFSYQLFIDNPIYLGHASYFMPKSIFKEKRIYAHIERAFPPKAIVIFYSKNRRAKTPQSLIRDCNDGTIFARLEPGHHARFTSSIAPTILISPASAMAFNTELLTMMSLTVRLTFASATICTSASLFDERSDMLTSATSGLILASMPVRLPGTTSSHAPLMASMRQFQHFACFAMPPPALCCGERDGRKRAEVEDAAQCEERLIGLDARLFYQARIFCKLGSG